MSHSHADPDMVVVYAVEAIAKGGEILIYFGNRSERSYEVAVTAAQQDDEGFQLIASQHDDAYGIQTSDDESDEDK